MSDMKEIVRQTVDNLIWRVHRRKVSAIESRVFGEAWASAETPETKASLSRIRPFFREVLGLEHKQASGPRIIIVDPEATDEEKARQIVQAINDIELLEE